MKKITFLLVAMLAFCWQGHAQFTESFDTEIPATWTIVNVDGGDTWVHNTTDNYLGAGHARISWDSNAHDDYLISPQFTVTSGVSDRISFWAAISSGWTETFEVRLSTTGNAPADFTEVLGSETATVDVATYEKFTYNLSAYNGVPVYIAIRATDTDRFYLHIDEFVNDAAPSCTPTVVDSSTVVDDCGNSQFSVDVVVSTVGDGTFVSDGTNTFPIVAGTVTAGPYANGDTVTLTVEHSDGACDFSLGDFSTGCTLPGEVCENSIIVASLPYSTTDDTSNYGDDYTGSPGASGCGTTSSYLNGDDVVYSYTATADTSINVSMTPTASWSGIFVYTDCADIGVNCVAGSANSGTSERNFDLTVTNGTTYYFVISTFASPQSTGYTLSITENTCTAVTATYNVVDDCDVSGGFYVEVDVTDMGSATAITVSDDQGNPSQPLTAIGTLQFGPYVNGTDVVITIDDDNDDDSCTVTSSAITQTVCPPANDECADAIALTVNPDYGCGTVTSGTIEGATDSGVNVCGGTEDDDVWYSFVATATEHRVSLINVAGSTTDMYHAVYDATPGCGALTTAVICSDANTSNLTGLTIGNTYYVQVYTWTSTGGQTSTFDICVGTPPTCPVPTGLGATNITTMSADLEWTDNAGASAWDIEWGTNGFTPSGTPNIEDTTNPHPLGGLSASSSYDFYVRADCGGGDTSTWAGPYTFVTADPPPACGENFYDTGGASGNYSANENYTITICPDVPGDAVTVEFNSFVVEGRSTDNCWDMLYIFDGSDNTATPITPGSLGIGVDTNTTGFCWQGAGDGTADLTGQVITSTDPSGCLTFTFTSDGSGQYAGWDATISCATIGTQEYNMNEKFSYYPNPVNNTLSLRGVKDIQNVAVYNMLGQEVLRTAPNTVNSDVDMSGLQSGTYFVKVMIENTTKTIKVIKK
jgi:hypothetical protein